MPSCAWTWLVATSQSTSWRFSLDMVTLPPAQLSMRLSVVSRRSLRTLLWTSARRWRRPARVLTKRRLTSFRRSQSSKLRVTTADAAYAVKALRKKKVEEQTKKKVDLFKKALKKWALEKCDKMFVYYVHGSGDCCSLQFELCFPHHFLFTSPTTIPDSPEQMSQDRTLIDDKALTYNLLNCSHDTNSCIHCLCCYPCCYSCFTADLVASIKVRERPTVTMLSERWWNMFEKREVRENHEGCS